MNIVVGHTHFVIWIYLLHFDFNENFYVPLPMFNLTACFPQLSLAEIIYIENYIIENPSNMAEVTFSLDHTRLGTAQ